jgi:hypothetical protein
LRPHSRGADAFGNSSARAKIGSMAALSGPMYQSVADRDAEPHFLV